MNTPLTAVLVGCGSISGAWLKPLAKMPEVKITGLVDMKIENARKRAADFQLLDVEIGENLGKVLKKTKPDLVFDCTIPEAHTSVALTAHRHGCHVLGEKPLADSMPNARRIAAAARKAGKLHAVIQNRRFSPHIRQVRSVLESGKIGPVTTLNSDFYLGAHFQGFRNEMKHVLLLDMAIHTFDAARLICGGDPVAVYCHEWNPDGSWYAHGASAIAVFEMSNGIVYTYRGSWCSEGLNTTWECDWRAVGSKGSLLWDGGKNIRAESVSAGGDFIAKCEPVVIPEWDKPEMTGGHEGQIRDFILCVRTGRIPETTVEDNIKSLAMVFGAIKSAETGKRVIIK